MKILQLDLRAFGPFTNQSLDLSDGQFGLHLVFGPNEAGKSSSLRALRSFFFGIESRSTDNFIHPHPKMRIGAKLQAGDGTVLEFVRRKGNRNTLRDAADEKPVNESMLTSLLGGIDEATFTERYGLGYDELVRGGREIVSGGGDLGRSLFAAASGAANLKAVQTALCNEAEELFLPSARIRRINKSVAQYNELQKEIRELLLPTARWREHDKALHQAMEQRDAIRRDIKSKCVRQRELQQLCSAIPIAIKRAETLEFLAPVAQAPLLSDDFSEKRRSGVTALDIATRSQQSEKKKLEQLAETLAALPPDNDVFKHRQAITRLQQKLGSHLKAMEDRRLRVAERKTAMAAASSALLELGRSDLSFDDADQLRITPDQRVRIQNLGNEKSRLVERVENAEVQIADLGEQRDDIVRECESCPARRETERLSQVLAAARDAGQLEKQLAELTSQQQADIDVAQQGLAKLQGFNETLAQLEQLVLPSDETLDEFEQRLTAANQALDAAQAKLAAEEEELQRLDEQFARSSQGQDVPTEDDLQAARRLRDQGWALIQQQLAGEVVSDDTAREMMKQFDGVSNLSEAFSRAITQADHVGDRLRREATQVAELAQLCARQIAITTRIDTLKSKSLQAQSNCETEQSKWQELWKMLDVTPRSPREMRAWLRQARNLCDASTVQRARQKEIRRSEEELAGHRSELLTALGQSGTDAAGDVTLSSLIHSAEKALAAIESQNARRKQLEQDQQRVERELDKARRTAEKAATDLASWGGQWSEAIAPLALRDGAEPSEANAAAEATKLLLEHLDVGRSLEQRIDGIDRDAAEFEQEVHQACQLMAPALAGETVQRTVDALAELLASAQDTFTRRQELQKQIDACQLQWDDAERDREQAESLLATLCGEANCNTPAELPAAEEASRQRRERERELREADGRLIELSSGQSLDEFLSVLSHCNAQELAAELAAIDGEIDELRLQESSIGEEIGRQQSQLAQMNGSAKAAETRQQAEQLLASIRTDAEHYARLHLASVVLQRAVEQYRQRHQGPVLERASELFSTLTLGQFESLRADLDDSGSPVLVGIRHGGEVVHVGGMSDGTCDQLYLALRLASLETDLADRESIPLIVDDVLVMFDDDRAVAALKALAATSEKTQVILFTHHEHVMQLARQSLDDDVLFTHNLDSCERIRVAAPTS